MTFPRGTTNLSVQSKSIVIEPQYAAAVVQEAEEAVDRARLIEHYMTCRKAGCTRCA